MTPTKLSNQELIEKCELMLDFAFEKRVYNDEFDILTKLLSRFRILSGQGKMPMSREDIEKFIYANERQLWNYTHDISGECCIGSNTVRKLLLSFHTAQPAPVSVEDVIKVVMETYDDLFTDADFEPNLRNSLQTLFNPK